MNKPPPLSDRYAIYFPSGDQSGCQLAPGPLVICTGSPPPANCTQMSNLPPRSELYAMKRPSGDQVAPICRPSSNVSRVSGRDFTAARGGSLPPIKNSTATTANAARINVPFCQE